jgi:aromatic-L-amino-acid/L-tryptophan decarboxylase
MNNGDFKKYAHELSDWMANYLNTIDTYPVKPDILPGDVAAQLPKQAPADSESFDRIFDDFKSIIVPNMTHWQHPRFFGYFPANNSEPSILAEMLTATMGAQCMVWLTSPAAEELETRMMEWLRSMLGLPECFTGVIQDSSSSSALVAILSAREKKSGYRINKEGFTGERFRVYTSSQAHSSVDKGVRAAGIGSDNLVKIDTDENFAMIPAMLEAAIIKDCAAGYTPLCVVSTIGTTSSTAVDPIAEISKICVQYGCWHHIDASYAGTALLLPEMRWMSVGVEDADSFVFNPHKWMFTNFDCSAYFVRDKNALVNTFAISPEYLKTAQDSQVCNYRDWGIPLGRRFRSLKLWFVIRSYGVSGLRELIRSHITNGQWFKDAVDTTPGFERMALAPLNLICFRYKPKGMTDESSIDAFNIKLMQQLNDSGSMLLTHTKLNGRFAIRFVAAQTHSKLEHVKEAWKVIKKTAELL